MAVRRTLILFPGALGDLLCCWPAVDALRAAGSAVALMARPAWLDVLPVDAVCALSIDRREVADLFAAAALRPATRALFGGFTEVASFTGYGSARFAARLADAAGVTPLVHPFRPSRPGEHAVDYYARCLGVSPQRRALPVSDAAGAWASAFWHTHELRDGALVVHPGSGGRRKNWTGMAAVAAHWRARGRQVVVVAGPAESPDSLSAIARDALVSNEPLSRVAAVLHRASHYLGNDSGVSHLAAAVGVAGVVVFGPSDPATWRPLGDGLRIVHGRTVCARCPTECFCTHRVSVDEVCAALERA